MWNGNLWLWLCLMYKFTLCIIYSSQVQNLGIFFVKDIILEADIWAVTNEGNQLVDITDYSIEEVIYVIYLIYISLFCIIITLALLKHKKCSKS